MEITPEITSLLESIPHDIKGDGATLREEEAVRKGSDLEHQKTLNQLNVLKRTDKLDWHTHNILVVGVYGIAGSFLILFGWLGWHEAAPQQWRFLSPDETTSLSKFLFSGSIGSGVTAIFSYLNRK